MNRKPTKTKKRLVTRSSFLTFLFLRFFYRLPPQALLFWQWLGCCVTDSRVRCCLLPPIREGRRAWAAMPNLPGQLPEMLATRNRGDVRMLSRICKTSVEARAFRGI